MSKSNYSDTFDGALIQNLVFLFVEFTPLLEIKLLYLVMGRAIFTFIKSKICHYAHIKYAGVVCGMQNLILYSCKELRASFFIYHYF